MTNFLITFKTTATCKCWWGRNTVCLLHRVTAEWSSCTATMKYTASFTAVAFDFTHLIEFIYYASHGEIWKRKKNRLKLRFSTSRDTRSLSLRHIKAIQITHVFYTCLSSNYMSLDTPNSQKPHQPLVFFQPCENDVFPQSAAVLLTAGENPFLERSIPSTEKRRGEGEAVATQCRGYTIHTGLSGNNWGVTPALSEATEALRVPALPLYIQRCLSAPLDTFKTGGEKKKNSMTPSAGNSGRFERDFILVGSDQQISGKTFVLHKMH